MLTALKENKEYKISEAQKQDYLNGGYDIYEDGELVEYSPLKKIEYGKYAALQKEMNEAKESMNSLVEKLDSLEQDNKKLKAENKKLKDAGDGKLADENTKLTSEIETLKKELEEAKAGK